MQPFPLSTTRLLLDQPTDADIDLIATYCADPTFEAFMVLPWPYERSHAESFVREYVPDGWASGLEWTWAIRSGSGDEFLGVVGVRLSSGMVGFWLGAPHRGLGIMPEALGAATDAVFDRTDREDVLWECVIGNDASARAAQKAGYSFTGEAPGLILGRNGSPTQSWTGRFARGDDRTPKSGWPR